MDPENRAAINIDGVSVWLDVPFDELLARIPADGRRPLAADRAQMERLFAAAPGRVRAGPLRVDAGAAPGRGDRRADRRSRSSMMWRRTCAT